MTATSSPVNERYGQDFVFRVHKWVELVLAAALLLAAALKAGALMEGRTAWDFFVGRRLYGGLIQAELLLAAWLLISREDTAPVSAAPASVPMTAE